ncbi:alpha/beta hydrolase family protein [Variovorax sp. Sphag1AA]|uniref:alpha/beta hydrolase family protein n=1 Tax=Variovorax sp. Sphag1AA TaxID=2587027 RepID=UPI00160CB710|nr:alpha/beta hydrolase family protein [Variovorax sp. Sphag1AA]MBB3177117.1 pimeloyl-ACP methyl ester carboxylesterase [Variovorax sp. Sphag1AA]
MTDSKETPVQFGPDGSLLGIVTTPNDGSMEPVACLLLNMGATHRIGPRRINVKVARRLASHGISTIRIDLAGLGDSRAASGAEHYRTQAVQDMQAAMNLMGTMLGVRRFVVIGLCSGSANGLSLAVADSRVVGVLMFDGYSFPGRRSLMERNFRRALAAISNAAMIGKTSRWLHRLVSSKAAAAIAPDMFEPDAPEVTAASFRRSMTQVVERNVAMLLLYSGTMHVVDRHRDQLGPFANDPFVKQIEYMFDPTLDHSLTSLAAQETFMTIASDWVLRVAHREAPPSVHGALTTTSSGSSGTLPGKLALARDAIA